MLSLEGGATQDFGHPIFWPRILRLNSPSKLLVQFSTIECDQASFWFNFQPLNVTKQAFGSIFNH
jgi:hypothetical protein